MDNRAITLPPIALIATQDYTALSCDLFYLSVVPIQSKTKIVLYKDPTINPINEEYIVLHSFLHKNANSNKKNSVESEIRETLMISRTNQVKLFKSLMTSIKSDGFPDYIRIFKTVKISISSEVI